MVARRNSRKGPATASNPRTHPAATPLARPVLEGTQDLDKPWVESGWKGRRTSARRGTLTPVAACQTGPTAADGKVDPTPAVARWTTRQRCGSGTALIPLDLERKKCKAGWREVSVLNGVTLSFSLQTSRRRRDGSGRSPRHEVVNPGARGFCHISGYSDGSQCARLPPAGPGGCLTPAGFGSPYGSRAHAPAAGGGPEVFCEASRRISHSLDRRSDSSARMPRTSSARFGSVVGTACVVAGRVGAAVLVLRGGLIRPPLRKNA